MRFITSYTGQRGNQGGGAIRPGDATKYRLPAGDLPVSQNFQPAPR